MPRKILIIALSICLAILFLVYFSNNSIRSDAHKASAKERKENSFEDSYTYLAAHLGMPGLCKKIYEGAYFSVAFTRRGHNTGYTKSICYWNTAVAMQKPELCKNVIPRRAEKTLFSSGDGINESECRREVRKMQGQFNMDEVNSDIILPFMGYGSKYRMKYPEGSYIERHSKNDSRIYEDTLDLYLEIRNTSEFRKHVKYLPDFSSGAFPENYPLKRMGCAKHSPKWHCIYARCLKSPHQYELSDTCFLAMITLQSMAESYKPGVPPALHQQLIPAQQDNIVRIRQQLQPYTDLSQEFEAGLAYLENLNRK